MKKALVLIPTYNEVMNIGVLVDAIHAVEGTQTVYAFDILILDDRSQDGTIAAVKKLQKEYKNLHLSLGQKQGLGKAYLRGFRYSMNHPEYEVVIMMDGDLSHDPKDIPKLLRAISEGYDYVIGSRYVSGGVASPDWPRYRVVLSKVANRVSRKLLAQDIEAADLTGGFKAIRSALLKKIDLNDPHSRGYVFQVSLLYAVVHGGYRITEVPITFSNRKAGRSKLHVRDIFEFLQRTYTLNPDGPVQRIVRFAFVGAAGTIVNLASLALLHEVFGVHPNLALIIAIEVSIIFNYFANHYFTFRAHHKAGHNVSFLSFLKFNAGTLIGACISYGAFFVLYNLIGVHYLVADALGIITALSWNYWMSTHYIWRMLDKE